jgi:metal-dependent hydrolase (beta-lactamase superfamily II)
MQSSCLCLPKTRITDVCHHTQIIVLCISHAQSDHAISLDSYNKETQQARHWWLTPIILATQEAEIRKIAVQSQPRPKKKKNLSQKRAGGVS